jgi:hypothetical protein
MQSVLLIAATLAVAQAPGLCCMIDATSGVCSTDAAKDGGRAVTIKRTSAGKVSATVRNLAGTPDGVYPCLDLFPTGQPVF